MTTQGNSGYRVLARKYRPQRLEDLIGQEILVQVLSNAIELGRLPHAFILTGVRGVGKTTSARILARMLNCVGPDGQGKETVSPCGVCEQCRAILEDRHIDVIEMDAASRTGVDDIREVIEGARYKATFGRYKVYIIDEVHMLSRNAFNALLKTLEEPPAHVKFIFATTEIRKVPDTVLSRCVRFELRRFTETDIVKLFRRVLENEKVEAEEGALNLLARAARGSARDGLSLLDQALNLESGPVREQSVRQMLNISDRGEILGVFEFLVTGNVQSALRFLATHYKQGGDLGAFLNDLLSLCHWLALLKADADLAEEETATENEKVCARDLAARLPMPVLVRFWQVLLKGIQEAELAGSLLQSAQMLFVRLAYMAAMPTPDQIIRSLSDEAGETVIKDGSFLKLGAGSVTDSMIPGKQESQKVPEMHDHNKGERETREYSHTPEESGNFCPVPGSFEDLVKLAGQKKEPLLQASLHHDVHLIDYHPGRISFRLSALAPRDFVLRLREKLVEWTGISWEIHVLEEGGEPTLEEQKKTEATRIRNEVQEHPLIKATMENFPGAVIEKIEER